MAFESYANGWPDLKKLDDLAQQVASMPTFTSTDKAALEEFIANEQAIIQAATLATDVGELQTTVGDASSGLVKDVDDLQTTVGDNTAGLVKDVADLKTATAVSDGTITDATGFTHHENSYVKKIGSLINVNFRSNSIDLTATTSTNIAQISEGCRPGKTIYFAGVTEGGEQPIRGAITTSGQIYLTSYAGLTSGIVIFNVSYIVAPPASRDGDTNNEPNEREV